MNNITLTKKELVILNSMGIENTLYSYIDEDMLNERYTKQDIETLLNKLREGYRRWVKL